MAGFTFIIEGIMAGSILFSLATPATGLFIPGLY
jgi:hypothetical protein